MLPTAGAAVFLGVYQFCNMNYGHFDDTAKEYVITRPDTPRPWSNYLGSTEYGAIITNHAGGYSFYKSGATGRFLRMRFNGIPMDQPGRTFYLRDQESGDFWSGAWQPVAKPLTDYTSVCRHGMAYTILESEYSGIKTEVTYFVPLGQTFEYWRMKVTNTSCKRRELSVFTYCEFANLWHTFQDLVNLQYSQFITRATMEDGIMGITCNPNYDFDGKDLTGCNRTWIALTGAPLAGYESVRERFLGTYGGYAAPEVVVKGQCSNFLGEGDNICGGLQATITLAPGESKELIVLLGLGTVGSHGKKTVAEFGNSARCETEFKKLKAAWAAPPAHLPGEDTRQGVDSHGDVVHARHREVVMMDREGKPRGRPFRRLGLALELTFGDGIGEGIVERHQHDALLLDVFRGVVGEAGALRVVHLLHVRILPVLGPAGVDVEDVAGQQAAPFEALHLQHVLDVLGGHELPALHRLALAEMRVGVEQHRRGDERRHVLHAELQQR